MAPIKKAAGKPRRASGHKPPRKQHPPSHPPRPPAKAPPRKRTGTEPERSESEAPPDPGGNGAASLAPVLQEMDRIVSRADLSRWSTPSEALQADVHRILAEAEHPVLMTFPREGSRRDAQRALQKLVAKLHDQLRKAPVPPTASKDAPLGHEQLVHKTMELEAVLEPTLRHTAELETELARQKARLAEDESHLRVLQANAKAQEGVRARQARTLPRVLRSDPPPPTACDSVDRINLSGFSGATAYYVDGDREMRPVAAQLHQHLQSMQANASALADVPPSILRASAAVEELLVRAGPTVRSAVLGV